MKRILAIMLILAMSVSVFSACSKTASKDTGGKVTLRWVFPGPGKQVDQDKVYAEFNKRLQEYLPNTEVKFECYANNEYAEKWKLMAASGEDVDLVGVYGLNVAEEIRKGAFIPIDDLIKKNAPEIPKQLPAILLKQARLDNQTYYIPAYQMLYGMLPGIRLPEELVKKSNLNLDKLKEIALSEPMLTNKFFDYFEENYLKPLKASGNLQKGVGMGSWEMLMSWKNLDNLESGFLIKRDDPSCKVYFYDELPEIKAYYEKMRDWNQKGYIRSDVQSVQNLRVDEGKKDGYIAWVHAYAKDIAESESTKSGFPIKVTPIDDYFYISSGMSTIGTAISRTSKNPDSAMKLLELMNTDKGKDLYNLIVYGIEGEHYTKTGENKIQTNYKSGGASSSDNFGLFNFIMGNTFLGYETQTTAEGWNKYVLQENEKAKQSKLVAFKANTSNIKVEVAQLSSIGKEFKPSFRMGVSTNFEQTWQQYIDKCKGAGLEKVRAELQKQVDEFLKNNK